MQIWVQKGRFRESKYTCMAKFVFQLSIVLVEKKWPSAILLRFGKLDGSGQVEIPIQTTLLGKSGQVKIHCAKGQKALWGKSGQAKFHYPNCQKALWGESGQAEIHYQKGTLGWKCPSSNSHCGHFYHCSVKSCP